MNQQKTFEWRNLFFNNYARMAVAAAFITVVAGTYLINNNIVKKMSTALVSIQEIPNDEIINYINNNEAIAELDIDADLTKENTSLQSFNENEIQKIHQSLTQ
jgi:predicted house-cleaning NTP pyrophosphatase (Maf/HAM1 superfamily)